MLTLFYYECKFIYHIYGEVRGDTMRRLLTRTQVHEADGSDRTRVVV